MKNSNWKRSLYIIYTSIYIFIAITKAEDVANITENTIPPILQQLNEANLTTLLSTDDVKAIAVELGTPSVPTIIDTSTTTVAETTTITTTIEATTTTGELTLLHANHTSTRPPDTISRQSPQPADCSQREKSRNQPKATSSSRLRKCCPLGENLDIYRENQSDSMCDSAVLNFEPTIISAVLFDNCIEDLEIAPELSYEIGNPCNSSFQYDDTEDAFYIMQDGSLLIIDKNGNESYTVEENYCMDQDKSGTLVVFVCITQVEEVSKAKVIIVAVLMLVSMPCLLLVSYLHLTLRMLRNLHGWSLALMSLCLACGYFVYSVVHIYGIPDGGFIGYVIQFFILSFFFWYLCICCNVLLNIWYKLPYYVQWPNYMIGVNFAVYLLISIAGPAILVTLTVQKGLPGMPSYFLQGLTESIRESQRYFIPPVSTILGLSFLVMIISFFGFQRIKADRYLPANDEKENGVQIHQFDIEKYEDVKKDAKCVALLGIIIILAWFFEIVTFYSPGNEVYLLICDMINGLQGLWIMLIFLVVRRRRTIILRWWYDRGSHAITPTEGGTELQPVNKAANPT